MGAADVVPGVSGGTIAFIAGIYEEFIHSIKSIGPKTFKILKEEGVKAAWKSINGNFLLVLFLGIGTSIVSLAKVISYLLEHHPIGVWSFFFGLVLASIFLVGKKVKQWNALNVIALLAATGLAYWITILNGAAESDSYPYIFLSGMIAICAMILPGISGSFILLLMGSYAVILEAVKAMELPVIGVFILGCIIGLAAFSRVLSWLFKHYHDITIAILTGFLIGSLNKIWPWKETISTRINSKGEEVPFIQENIAPDEHVGMAILWCVLGFVVIFGLEFVARKWGKEDA